MLILFNFLAEDSKTLGEMLKDGFEYFIPITIAMIVLGVIFLVISAIKPFVLLKILEIIGGIVGAVLFVIGMIAVVVFYFKDSPEKDAGTLFWLSIADLIIWMVAAIIYRIKRAKYIIGEVKNAQKEFADKRSRKEKRAMEKTDEDFK